MNSMTGNQCARHSRTSSRRRTCLTVRERAVGFLAVVLIVASALLSGGGRATDVETHIVTISKGQTLWSLAETHPVPGLDTARTADLIADMNDLESGRIVTGASLKVPSTAASNAVAMR